MSCPLSPGRASQHLLLLSGEGGADANLADDPRPDSVHTVDDVAFDELSDRVGGHAAYLQGVRHLQVESRTHNNVEASRARDGPQSVRVSPDSSRGDIRHRPPSQIPEDLDLLGGRLRIVKPTVVSVAERVHSQLSVDR